MKKQILEALKTRFSGVSDTILDRIAAKLAKTITTEDEIKAAVEAVTFQSVLESYGDSRATEAQQTAVKNYEQKYGLKDGKAIQTGGGAAPESGENGGEDSKTEEQPEWAKALIEQNKALTERLNAMDAEKVKSGRRAQLDGVIAKLPEQFRAPYARMDVSSMTDEEFQTQLASVTTEVDGIAATLKSKGAVFGVPKSDKSSAAASEDDVPANVLAFLDGQAKKDEDAQNF